MMKRNNYIAPTTEMVSLQPESPMLSLSQDREESQGRGHCPEGCVGCPYCGTDHCTCGCGFRDDYNHKWREE